MESLRESTSHTIFSTSSSFHPATATAGTETLYCLRDPVQRTDIFEAGPGGSTKCDMPNCDILTRGNSRLFYLSLLPQSVFDLQCC